MGSIRLAICCVLSTISTEGDFARVIHVPSISPSKTLRIAMPIVSAWPFISGDRIKLWAANGVPLRVPLNPQVPVEDHEITRPRTSNFFYNSDIRKITIYNIKLLRRLLRLGLIKPLNIGNKL
ncbi:hypothetical protein Ahy_A10g048501 [Arachis hypogaea]|uniref:Uncharacterized protein n=1 Tax=Arachis hypogaea TaxID=3818 RepID=A0A445B5C8_ARAHY|nr:hypothetical protein Ahy_A10g048501 [Arachis hypogaea]